MGTCPVALKPFRSTAGGPCANVTPNLSATVPSRNRRNPRRLDHRSARHRRAGHARKHSPVHRADRAPHRSWQRGVAAHPLPRPIAHHADRLPPSLQPGPAPTAARRRGDRTGVESCVSRFGTRLDRWLVWHRAVRVLGSGKAGVGAPRGDECETCGVELLICSVRCGDVGGGGVAARWRPPRARAPAFGDVPDARPTVTPLPSTA